MAGSRLATLRRLTARILAPALIVLALVALVSFVAPDYPRELIARFSEHGPTATLTDLTRVDQLQAAFNKRDGEPRLILLFSPT